MGLNTALVDQARVLGLASSALRVEGTTVYEETMTAWFRARLEVGKPTGAPMEASGAQQSVKNPTLMVGVRDSAGRDITITGQDRIEVDSKQLGRETFEVVGDPEPIRKKRRVIGWTVQLRKVELHRTPGLG